MRFTRPKVSNVAKVRCQLLINHGNGQQLMLRHDSKSQMVEEAKFDKV